MLKLSLNKLKHKILKTKILQKATNINTRIKKLHRIKENIITD